MCNIDVKANGSFDASHKRPSMVHSRRGDWSIFRPIVAISTNNLCPKTWTCPLPFRPVNGYRVKQEAVDGA